MKNQENSSYEELKKQALFLHSKNLSLTNENSTLQNQLSSATNENSYLKEQLAWLQKQIFGKKSEKIIDVQDTNQLYLRYNRKLCFS